MVVNQPNPQRPVIIYGQGVGLREIYGGVKEPPPSFLKLEYAWQMRFHILLHLSMVGYVDDIRF